MHEPNEARFGDFFDGCSAPADRLDGRRHEILIAAADVRLEFPQNDRNGGGRRQIG